MPSGLVALGNDDVDTQASSVLGFAGALDLTDRSPAGVSDLLDWPGRIAERKEEGSDTEIDKRAPPATLVIGAFTIGVRNPNAEQNCVAAGFIVAVAGRRRTWAGQRGP